MRLTSRTFCQMLAGIALLMAPALPILAQTISEPQTSTYTGMSGMNAGLSGICYAGGTQYYACDDSGGVMQPATIAVDLSNGRISSAAFATQVYLGGSDLEGIAYNPARNSVFVSDESGATIKECTTTGTYRTTVSVPQIFKSFRGNYSLEALTIRGDGLEMWTCNEEALYNASHGVDDGPLSTASAGTVIRLQRFSRSHVDGTWVANGQWAYLTQSYRGDGPFISEERSGVSGLCVLPDGTLLVLERSAGGYFPSFENVIYKVNFAGATDTSNIQSLNGASYTRVTKEQLWKRNFGINYNFEGICLGPRLNDGSTSILLIADGDSPAKNGLFALKLNGMTIRNLTVSTPYGPDEPVSGMYRYMQGASVTHSVNSPIPVGTTTQRVCTGWVMTGGNTPASGTTSSVTTTVNNDGELTWQWETQYKLAVEAWGTGTTSHTNEWHAANATVSLYAYPPEQRRSPITFVGWIGEVPAGQSATNNPIYVPMSKGRTLSLCFPTVPRARGLISRLSRVRTVSMSSS